MTMTFKADLPREKSKRIYPPHTLPELSMLDHISKYDCQHILNENPWLKDVKLLQNNYFYSNLVRADYNKFTIELSRKLFEYSLSTQRVLFIQALCHMIAVRLFNHSDQGTPYRLLVKRYTTNKVPVTALNKLAIIENSKVKTDEDIEREIEQKLAS